MDHTKLKRTSEPIWWALFSAGGVCFAVFIPTVILVFALALPFNYIKLDYAQVKNWVFHIVGLFGLGVVLILPAFHAVHRIRHILLDLKFESANLIQWISYGLAFAFSLTVIGFWFLGFIG